MSDVRICDVCNNHIGSETNKFSDIKPSHKMTLESILSDSPPGKIPAREIDVCGECWSELTNHVRMLIEKKSNERLEKLEISRRLYNNKLWTEKQE